MILKVAKEFSCSPLEIRKKWTRAQFLDAIEYLNVQAEIEMRKADAMQ